MTSSVLDILTSLDQISDGTPVAIYGAGGRGVEISQIIRANPREITLVAFLDDFKAGEIDGIRVCTLADLDDEVRRRLAVIIGTIHAGDVVAKIHGVAKTYLTDLKRTRSEADYYSANELPSIRQSVAAVTAALGDEPSRTLFTEIMRARSRQPNRLIELYRDGLRRSRQYLDYLNMEAIGHGLDGGVFDGFTSLQFIRLFPRLERMYGFDIFPEFLSRSAHGASVLASGRFFAVHAALSDKEGEVLVSRDPGHGSASRIATGDDAGETHPVAATRIDTFRATLPHALDFIKLDLEGADFAALRGAMKTIEVDRPQLAISIYHSKQDVVDIPAYLMERLSGYRFYLGHYSSELTETVLYAIPAEADTHRPGPQG